jgi:lysyl-tRNA synthetase class 2
MSLRRHGRLTFAQIQDESGAIQLYLDAAHVGRISAADGDLDYAALNLLDVGDIIEATGPVMRTRRGEISVDVKRIRLLAKSLRPLPDKWAGIANEELRIRQRHLDIIMTPSIRNRFRAISDILQALRAFLVDNDFIEVLTPILQPLYGGGRAKPFTTHLNVLDMDLYLGISQELYLKRMIVAGFERVFTIGRYFRNEGMDRLHHPEFNMLETMTAYQNYEFNMDLIEELYQCVAERVVGSPQMRWGHHQINLEEWTRLSMVDAVSDRLRVDFRRMDDLEAANRLLTEHGLDGVATVGDALVELFESLVVPTLIQPTLVYEHPVEISPLAKRRMDDPRYVERFEIFIGGEEHGDNWTELNDPVELVQRFRRETGLATSDTDFHPLDWDFIEAVEFGMPPTTGLGPGIERLAMLMTNAHTISDVIFFPLLRPRGGSVHNEQEP